MLIKRIHNTRNPETCNNNNDSNNNDDNNNNSMKGFELMFFQIQVQITESKTPQTNFISQVTLTRSETAKVRIK